MREAIRGRKRHTNAHILGLFLAALLAAGCVEMNLPREESDVSVAETRRLLLLVEQGLYPVLVSHLGQYMSDLSDEGCTVELRQWEGGDAESLRELLRSRAAEGGIGGAFFVGNLPSAWYEQTGLNGHEEFPCDLYFMELDGSWKDQDMSGVLDSHPPFDLDIFVSRIDGEPVRLRRYFEKVHSYRSGALSVWEGAYVFKDDDWIDFRRGSSFELSCIYPSVTVCEDTHESIRSEYVARLTGPGAEYVYQWIHSYPPLLCIEGTTAYEYVGVSDIEFGNFKGMFYNLFNCSASRFTEENLAAAYLIHTDYGLATIGSTKVGGNYYPKAFHLALAQGGRWGDAFRTWYTAYGVTDDRWFMGMVILGDPMLTLSVEAWRVLKTISEESLPPRPEEIEDLEEVFRSFGHESTGLGFKEYRSHNLQLFEP